MPGTERETPGNPPEFCVGRNVKNARQCPHAPKPGSRPARGGPHGARGGDAPRRLRDPGGRRGARPAGAEGPGAARRARPDARRRPHRATGSRACSGATAATRTRATASSTPWRGSAPPSGGDGDAARRRPPVGSPRSRGGRRWTSRRSSGCSPKARPTRAEAAIALYRGDLLDGIGVRDPAFERLAARRARSGCAAVPRRPRPASWRASLAEGSPDRAAAAARRLIELDPLREDACRALMRHPRRPRRDGPGAPPLRRPARPPAPRARRAAGARDHAALRGDPPGPRSRRARVTAAPACPTRLRRCPTGRRSPSCRSRTSAATRSRSTSPTASSRRSSPRCRGCAGSS